MSKDLTQIEKKILKSMFIRSHLVFTTFNMVKIEANGFTATMSPAIEHLYKGDEEGRLDAYSRHQSFFNTHAVPFSFIAGLTYAMEKEHKINNTIDTATVDSIKTSLMGPTAGMFDALFFNVLRIIAAGIAIGLASNGSFLGPVIFILLYGVTQSVAKYYLLNLGFKTGTTFIESIYESGLIKALTKAASTLAIIMVGAMTAQMVNVPVNWTLNIGETELIISEVLDQVFPGILSILLIFLLVRLIKKQVKPTTLVVGIIAVSLFLSFLGIF